MSQRTRKASKIIQSESKGLGAELLEMLRVVLGVVLGVVLVCFLEFVNWCM